MNHWRAPGFSLLRIENWEGEFTVFQPQCGKTHFLNEMGLYILTLLHQSPATLETICQELSVHFTLQVDENFSEQIAKTLLRYEALGLTTRIEKNT
jgi:PqqD family protein of HPr-rel-A system